MTQTPLAIAIGSMHFSLKWHGIVKDMPGGVRWYAAWSVPESQILGQIPSAAPSCQAFATVAYMQRT